MNTRLHLKSPVRTPPVWVEEKVRDGVNVKAKQERISVTGYLRAALNLWFRDDPVAKLIVDEAKRVKQELGRVA